MADTKLYEQPDAHGNMQVVARTKGRYATHGEREGAVAPLSFAAQAPQTPPARAQVRYEQWDQNDNILEIGVDTVDLREVLDGYALSDLPNAEGIGSTHAYDEMFYDSARNMEQTRRHTGPYTIDIDEDEYREYIESRLESGQQDVIAETPNQPRADRERRVSVELDRVFGRQGFSGISNWTKLDAQHFAETAGDDLQSGLDAGQVQQQFLDKADQHLIERVKFAKDLDADSSDYVEQVQAVAFAVGDRLIERHRDALGQS